MIKEFVWGNMSNQSIEKEIQTESGRVVLHKNGLVYFHMRDNLSIDVEVAKQMVESVRALDGSGQARLLFIYGHNSDLSFAAQRYFATTKDLVSRMAFVSHNRLQAEMAQFLVNLLRALRSTYEFRIFHQVADAEEWLLNE